MLGMVIHGLARTSDDWDGRVIGQPPHLLGRASRAIQMLRDLYPETKIMLFGSGKVENGKSEGQETLTEILDNWDSLRDFEAFSHMWRHSFTNLKNKVRRIARTVDDPEANNTMRELEYAIPFFYGQGISCVVLISDPPHISRCMAHATEVVERMDLFGSVNIVAEHSDSFHPRQSASDVVVFEPPTDGTNLRGKTAKRFFKIPPERLEEVLDGVNAFLDEKGIGK